MNLFDPSPAILSRVSRAMILLLVVATGAIAQSTTQTPAPTGQVNDFAGVIDSETKSRLETTLRNLKERTKVDFMIATVDSTGAQEISPFSRQLARDWNVVSTDRNSKSLLLVISVGSKTSIAQMTRGAQAELPDGILGELSYRMRTPLEAGKFTEAVDTGVQFFLGALAKKTGVNLTDLDKPISAEASSTSNSTETPVQTIPVSDVASIESTRPRTVTEPPKVEPAAAVTENVKPPKSTSSSRKQTENAKNTPAAPKTTPEEDADESEEVELTLTLPLAKRAVALKKFLDTHPDSKSRVRAQELLISTHAGLGDQQLKEGNTAAGIEQLLKAIDEADATITDKLFAGVISQIPNNLYLRGEKTAAFQAAQSVETKFGNDPKRLLSVAGFYLGIERGDETIRIAEAAVKLAPDMAEAHRILALGLHISLRLDEAAAEYKRTLELDPTSKVSRGSLADLSRAGGKSEEALALYEEQLKVDPKDRAARAGMVVSLLELGRKDEANSALEAALAADPGNLPLLTGAAYWFAAHGNNEKAFELARKAVGIEPRYTWAQIAFVRSLIGLKRPLDAERAMRFARQYGKFPTMEYELANVLTSSGLYDEGVEVLRGSFVINEGEIETRLAGRFSARKASFLELLAPERKAGIYQPTAVDSATAAQIMKGLLSLDIALTGDKPDEKLSVAALQDFLAGTDSMRTYRLVYAANRLIRSGVAYPTALELIEEARKSVDTALNVPSATMAVQAEEFRELRAAAIASGNVPAVADAPHGVLSNLFKGRLEDLAGWALFNQENYSEAVTHLRKAASLLPEATPSWRSALWHLGVALEQSGQNDEALNFYIKSYNEGRRDPVRRKAIENLYRKINGNIYGLDDRIGPAVLGESSSSPAPPGEASNKPAATPEVPSSTSTENPSTQPVVSTDKPADKPTTTLEPTPEVAKPETTRPASESSTQPAEVTQEEAMRTAARSRSRVKISGRILDANKNGISNVVVVLISPVGSVLASTTDSEGNYSFTVAPSQKTYRVIPSKDGFSFTPIDKAFATLIEDQREVDFVGSSRTP
jgi:tetratricopeptide (TPR) repeat protein/uncharacterized membrane protein YgcG